MGGPQQNRFGGEGVSVLRRVFRWRAALDGSPHRRKKQMPDIFSTSQTSSERSGTEMAFHQNSFKLALSV